MLACSPDTDKDIFRVSLLKTVLTFLTNQAVQFCSRGIAEYYSILLHFGRLRQYVFLLFQSLDVRASENLSAS